MMKINPNKNWTRINFLKMYSEEGAHLFPINKETKRPAIKNNLREASNDFDLLLRWEEQFDSPNWGISLAKSGWFGVDVDNAHGGLEKWATLIATYGEPKTLYAESGGSGKHFVFRAQEGAKYKGKIDKGIDIKHNGYIVVQPSIHPKGGPYLWRSEIFDVQPPPNWLHEIVVKNIPKQKVDIRVTVNYPEIASLIQEAKNFEYSYEEWVRVGMSIHSILPNNEGLGLFLEFTQNQSFEPGNLEQAEYKWTGFGRDQDSKVSIGTLVHILKEKGVNTSKYKISNSVEDQVFFDGIRIESARKMDGLIVFDKRNNIVEAINKLNYFVAHDGTKGDVGRLIETISGEKKVILFSRTQFQNQTGPLRFETENKKGDTVYLPASKIWLEHSNRKTYRRIVCDIETDENDLNLWPQISIQATEGNIDQFLDMIFVSLCNNDQENFEWVLSYLAHLIQSPKESVTTVPVLVSKKEGVGKGLVFDNVLRKILGPTHLVLNNMTMLGSRFNSFLAGKLLTFCDESNWHSSKQVLPQLKNIVGSDNLLVEYKNGPHLKFPNYSRYVMASNECEAVPVGIGNRRFYQITCSEKYANNETFFAPHFKQLKYGDLANRFYGYLLSRDLSNFSPHRFPKEQSATVEAKMRTQGPIAQFWYDLLFVRPRPVYLENKGLISKFVIQEYLEFLGRDKAQTNSYEFWAKTKSLIPCLGIKTKDVRQEILGGKADAYPTDLIKILFDFCKTLGIDPPDDFEPDRLFIRSEFTPGGSEEPITGDDF